nr:tetratricopeptide repeat protein [Microcoleaceae cyanobacterium MO_207.B10]
LARFYLQCALLLKPDFKRGHYNLGATYEKLHQLDKARREYQIADGISEAYSNLARLYIQGKQYSEAITLLEKAFQKKKAQTDPPLRYALLKNMGWALLEQERYPEAETYLREAIELMNTRAIAYKLLARLLEARGNTEEARDIWQKFRQYALNEAPQEYEY